MIWLFGGLALVAVVILILGLSGRPAGQELVEERVGGKPKKEKKSREEKSQTSAIGAAVDRVIAGRGFTQNMATQLARADMKVTVGEFIVFSVTMALLGGVIFYVLKRPILIPVGIVGGLFVPRLYIGSRQSQRLKAFNNQLGDALNLMVNSLRAGYSTLQAMEVISKEMPEPIAGEFSRVVLEMQLGVPFDNAMANLIRRMPSSDLDLVITAMSVQREVGGNLAEVLDSISFTIRERVRIKGEIKVLTAQGQITGYVITALPFALGGFIYVVNPGYMGQLLNDPCGWLMLGIALVMIVIGYVVVRKIVSIEI